MKPDQGEIFMKTVLVLLAFVFSSVAFADNNCEIVVFGKLITGSGRSLNAAKADTRIKCIRGGNNAMFCSMDKMNCSASLEQPMAYCEIVAFSDFYYSVQSNSQFAADDVRQQCLSKQNQMFCTSDKITCLDL